MPTKPHRVRIDPESELARLLDEVGETPVLLEKNGKVYRLTMEMGAVEMDNHTRYDPEEVKLAIRKSAGSWADIDADTFLANLYRAREEGSRTVTRP
jgi:hypothetical protein